MGFNRVLMFCPLTIYKQLIILHYNIGFVKSEDINKHGFFSKIIIQIFTKPMQSYGFILFHGTSHHVIIELCYILIGILLPLS
jgi:hypothetical protein